MNQELVFIDINKSILMFYNIKIEKNKTNYYLIVTYGKIGNKGKTIIIYKGNDYSFCKNEFWKRVNDKKQQNYKKLSDVSKLIDNIFNIDSDDYVCAICNKQLNQILYNKINRYLREETNVDDDKKNVLYGKVACFECQNKYGVYKGKNIE